MGVSEYPAPGETTAPRNDYKARLAAQRLVKQRRARKLERKNKKLARRK